MSKRTEALLRVVLVLSAVASCGRVLEDDEFRADATATSGTGGADATADRTLCRGATDCSDGSSAARDADASAVDSANPTWPDGALPLDTDGGCPCGQLGCACCNYTSCAGTLTCQIGLTCIFTASTTLAQEAEESITFVAADATSVYWCAFDGVKSVPKQGGAVKTLASEAAPDGGSLNCPGLVVDDTSVYWANAGESTGGIFSVSKAGGPAHALATTSAPPTSLYLAGGNLYWTTDGTFWTETSPGSVLSMPASGGAPVIVPGLTNVECIAPAGNILYWYEAGNGGPSSLGVSPLSGGVGTTLLTLPDSPGCYGLAAYGSEVFASTDDGTIGASTATGMNAVLDAADESGPLAVDGSGVYEIEDGSVAVWRPGEGHFYDLYTAGIESSVGIALDTDFVYWATEEGALIKSAKW
jgi:hypothetical protein